MEGSRDMFRMNALSFALSLLALASFGAPTVGAQDGPDLEVREYDTIFKKDGTTLTGTILEENVALIELMTTHRAKLSIRPEDVERIQRRVTAEQAFENRLQYNFDPKNAEHYFQLAQWSQQHPELQEKTTDAFLRTVELDPSRGDAFLSLFPLLDQTAPVDLSGADRDRQLGAFLGGMDAGLEMLQLPSRTAELFEAMGDRESAIFMLRRALAVPEEVRSQDPVGATVEQRLAVLLNQEGKREEARELVEDILGQREDGAAQKLLQMRAAWLLEDLSQGKADVEQRFLDTIQRLLAVDPKDPDAYLLRGSYRLMKEDFEGANQDLYKAGEVGAMGGVPIVTYALQFALQGEFKKANEALAQIRKVTAVRHQHRMVSAYLLENQGELEQAVELLKESVAEADAPWQAWVLYLQTLAKADPNADLQREGQPFLERFQDNPVAFAEGALLLAQHALQEGDEAGARRWLDYAGMVNEGDAEYYLATAHAHLREGGDPRRARAALTLALELDPEGIATRNALAFLEYREGNFGAARDLFDEVIARFSEEQRDEATPPAELAYALRCREFVAAAIADETWRDDFNRASGDKVLNNWDEQETFNVEIGLRDGAASFRGQQDFEDDGLTVLSRSLSGDRLVRIRMQVRIKTGASALRLGLRLEDEDQQNGIVFLRDKDGVLKFSLNRGDGSTVFEVPDPATVPEGQEEEPDSDDPSARFDMVRVEWPADSEVHVLEIELDRDQKGSGSLYFDGVRVARNVDIPFRGRRGDINVGVSGSALKGKSYDFEVLNFEIFRQIPEGNKRRRM